MPKGYPVMDFNPVVLLVLGQDRYQSMRRENKTKYTEYGFRQCKANNPKKHHKC